jgi:hypothetical protein
VRSRIALSSASNSELVDCHDEVVDVSADAGILDVDADMDAGVAGASPEVAVVIEAGTAGGMDRTPAMVQDRGVTEVDRILSLLQSSRSRRPAHYSTLVLAVGNMKKNVPVGGDRFQRNRRLVNAVVRSSPPWWSTPGRVNEKGRGPSHAVVVAAQRSGLAYP